MVWHHSFCQKCTGLSSIWKEFDESNIGSLLEQRYHSGKMRKAGLRTRGPKPFTKEDHEALRLAFEQALAEK